MGSVCSRTPDESRDALVNILPSPVLLQPAAAAAEEETGHVIRSFPTAVVIEILSRLPIKSLARCQVISKEWRSLIHDPYLAEMHLDRGGAGNLLFNSPAAAVGTHSWFRRRIRNLVYRIVDPICYLHGCNGLILILNLNTKKHHVWNPAIRRALELPDPNPRALGFAFSYVRNCCKIVSFYKDNIRESLLCCQVITPGDDEWRELEVPEIAKSVTTYKRGAIVSVVLTGAAVHYVCDVDVVSLDLETEIFTVSRFPGSSRKSCRDIDWDGKLGFAEVVGENLEVVELEDYKSGRWGEKKRVVRLGFENRENAIPLLAKKGEIWFWMKDEKIFKYTIQTGRCRREREAGTMFFADKMFTYKPSLISFDGMVPDTMFRPYAKFL